MLVRVFKENKSVVAERESRRPFRACLMYVARNNSREDNGRTKTLIVYPPNKTGNPGERSR